MKINPVAAVGNRNPMAMVSTNSSQSIVSQTAAHTIKPDKNKRVDLVWPKGLGNSHKIMHKQMFWM